MYMYSLVNKMYVSVFVRSFVCILALRPRPTANVISGLSVILTLINKIPFARRLKHTEMIDYFAY